MKFLKRSFWTVLLILTWLLAILIVLACIPYLPQGLLRFFTGSEFGRFLFELFLNLAMLGIAYGLQRWVLCLYSQSKGQNGPAPTPRPIRRAAPPPERSAAAGVIALRKKVRQRKDGWDEIKYTAGFRLEDGQEVWLRVSEPEYRRLSEGDRGRLSFQGDRYLGFERASAENG